MYLLMSGSGWCDPGEDPWDWISQLGLNSLSDGTDGLLEMPKLTNEDLAAEHQPADEDIVAATSQAIKDFMGWSEPPLALVCENLALSLSRKGLLRLVSNEKEEFNYEFVPDSNILQDIPESDLRADIYSNNATHSYKLVHMPTGEVIGCSGIRSDPTRSLFFLKEEALNILRNREAVVRYYENQKDLSE